MMRLVIILMLILGGLPRVGSLFANNDEPAGAACCGEMEQAASCCGSAMAEDGFCPMSNGPCRCGVAPAPDRDDWPKAPLPRSDRSSATFLAIASPAIAIVIEPDGAPGDSRPWFDAPCRGGQTHNEWQAILGVWRT